MSTQDFADFIVESKRAEEQAAIQVPAQTTTIDTPQNQPVIVTPPAIEVPEQKPDDSFQKDFINLLDSREASKKVIVQWQQTDNQQLPDDSTDIQQDSNNDSKDVDLTTKYANYIAKVEQDREDRKVKATTSQSEMNQIKIQNEILTKRYADTFAEKQDLVSKLETLEKDPNRLPTPKSKQMQDLVYFWSKYEEAKANNTVNDILERRTLSEAIAVVEQITNLSLDDVMEKFLTKWGDWLPQHTNAWSGWFGRNNFETSPQGNKNEDQTYQAMANMF